MKSIKLKNENYIDTTGIVHDKTPLSEILERKSITFDNEWIDATKSRGSGYFSIMIPFSNPKLKSLTHNIISAEYYDNGWKPATMGGFSIIDKNFFIIIFYGQGEVGYGVFLFRIKGTISIIE